MNLPYDNNGIRIFNYSIVNKTLYKLHKYDSGKEEVSLYGYDMGGRVIVVKWLSDKKLILKVSSRKVLCGARGCGMVFDFPTKYFMGEISDEKIPSDWNCWNGYITFTHEMECGRKWKEGLKLFKLLTSNFLGDVIIEYAPISERYWNSGDIVTIRNDKIRLGGCWFDFDDRYIVKFI